jgi:ssDNA-binding Zn-finger/Zn-ribbon topoisomerase 1
MARVPTLDQRSKARNDGLSRQMKRRMEVSKCPKCGRKGAVKSHSDACWLILACRYKDCDYEKVKMW